MGTKNCSELMAVEEVADDVISQLDEQEIDEVRRHPSSTDMHFGLGSWIRNEYIYSGKMGPVLIADSVSSEITEAIAKKALPEYADLPLAVSLFSGPMEAYASAHRYFVDRDVLKMVDSVKSHYDALAASEAEFDAIRGGESTGRPTSMMRLGILLGASAEKPRIYS